ncbi:hypothetical protein B9Z65_3307 [Elsinoe australis]|uniref:Uncharacterized protein n=1 Tax=Elsinoe australis TaxID=40998 RepID=A0A2P7ZY49_9PEZI|nr:hypothetical protein B9Z65_3307 [Elsinoe australis]
MAQLSTNIDALIDRLRSETTQLRDEEARLAGINIGIIASVIKIPAHRSPTAYILIFERGTELGDRGRDIICLEVGDHVMVRFAGNNEAQHWSGEVVRSYPGLSPDAACLEVWTPSKNPGEPISLPSQLDHCKSYANFNSPEAISSYPASSPEVDVVIKVSQDPNRIALDQDVLQKLGAVVRSEKQLFPTRTSMTEHSLVRDSLMVAGRIDMLDSVHSSLPQDFRIDRAFWDSVYTSDALVDALAPIHRYMADYGLRDLSHAGFLPRESITGPLPLVTDASGLTQGLPSEPIGGFRDTCLVQYFALDSEAADKLATTLSHTVCGLSPHSIVFRVHSESVDDDILMQAADEQAGRGSYPRFDVAIPGPLTFVATDWHNHHTRFHYHGDRDSQRYLLPERIPWGCVTDSLGFGMLVTSRLPMPAKYESLPGTAILRQSILRQGPDHFKKFRALYKQMSKPNPSPEIIARFTQERHRLRDFTLRCANAVVMTYDEARQPDMANNMLQPVYAVYTQTQKLQQIDAVSIRALYPTAWRLLAIHDPPTPDMLVPSTTPRLPYATAFAKRISRPSDVGVGSRIEAARL